MDNTKIDSEKSDAFADRMIDMLNYGALALMTSIGHRSGLFDTMKDMKPATSDDIAKAAGLNERYVREWLGAMVTGGIVDARFIAVVNTALESPLGQIAMIPMLAWIANSAPKNLKATFFAVMASFTNLALSLSNLGTKYLNQIYVVTREVKDPLTLEVQVAADYSQLQRIQPWRMPHV